MDALGDTIEPSINDPESSKPNEKDYKFPKAPKSPLKKPGPTKTKDVLKKPSKTPEKGKTIGKDKTPDKGKNTGKDKTPNKKDPKKKSTTTKQPKTNGNLGNDPQNDKPRNNDPKKGNILEGDGPGLDNGNVPELFDLNFEHAHMCLMNGVEKFTFGTMQIDKDGVIVPSTKNVGSFGNCTTTGNIDFENNQIYIQREFSNGIKQNYVGTLEFDPVQKELSNVNGSWKIEINNK